MIQTPGESSLKLSSPGCALRLELFGWAIQNGVVTCHAFAVHVDTPQGTELFELFDGVLNRGTIFIAPRDLSCVDDAFHWTGISLEESHADHHETH